MSVLRYLVIVLCLAVNAVSAQTDRIGAAARTGPPQLDTIHVTVASRTARSLVARTRSVEVITRDDIERIGARTIHDVLARAMALDVLNRSPASADVAIRGTSLGQVLVLVDGVRMTDRQTAHFDLDLAVPLDAVERIEIVRGPASAQYGADAVGGVINVVTADYPQVAARIRGGSFDALGASLSLPHVSAEYDRSTGHRPGTDYRVTSARAALGDATFGASIGQAVRDFGANSFYGPYDSHERTATTTGEAHAERALTTSLATQLSLSTRRHADQFTLRRTDPAFYRNRHVSLQSSLTSVVQYTPAAEAAARAVSLSAAVGAQLDDARLVSARLGDRHDITGAAFAQATLGESGPASVDLGLRSDWSNGFGTFVSPSLAASLRASQSLTLRASASRAFRAPSWTERYYSDPANVGNPDLTAERFVVGEVGARAYPAWGGRLDVALWARRGTGVIDWVKPSDSLETAVWRTRNISTIDYRGGDGELTLPPFAGVTLATHVSLLDFDASSAAGYTGKYALRPLTSMVGGRAHVASWSRATLTLDGRRFRRADDDRAHLLAGAHVTVLVRDARVSVHLENLANADYLDVAGRPVAGRGVMVAVGRP